MRELKQAAGKAQLPLQSGLLSGLLFGVLSGMLFGIAGCATKQTGYSDFDVGTDFSTYQSFSWIPGKALVLTSPDPVNPALEGFLKAAVQDNLSGRGYRYTANAEEADMLIGFAVGSTSTVRTTAFTESYRQSQIVGSMLETEVVNQESMEGGIVIDIYDQASGEKKWMGWTETEITRSDQVNLQPAVREQVGIVLAHFPPDL